MKKVLCDNEMDRMPGWAFRIMAFMYNLVDIIYALDMFHMVKDTQAFLKELHRLTKPGGTLYIEDGHQPRARAIDKIRESGCWDIIEENKAFIKCKPRLL